MKNIFIIVGVVLLLFAVAVWWSKSLQLSDSDIVSPTSIHWHPRIEIFVKGEKQEIPANVGIGMRYAGHPQYDPRMGMVPMHTHEHDGVIHMEFPGRVTKEDATLGNFFSMWGKDFSQFGSSVKMTVNGKENTEFGDYEMKDGDKIQLAYE